MSRGGGGSDFAEPLYKPLKVAILFYSFILSNFICDKLTQFSMQSKLNPRLHDNGSEWIRSQKGRDRLFRLHGYAWVRSALGTESYLFGYARIADPFGTVSDPFPCKRNEIVSERYGSF